MARSSEETDVIVSSIPRAPTDQTTAYAKSTIDLDQISNADSSRSGSTSEVEGSSRNVRTHMPSSRPKLHHRKSSGTIIVPRDAKRIEIHDEEYEEGDARTMSPRRSSEEVDRLEEGLRQNMI